MEKYKYAIVKTYEPGSFSMKIILATAIIKVFEDDNYSSYKP